MMGLGGPDALDEPFDLVVVGGGIQGAMVLLEAARRGFRTLLLERDDFGGGTSWSSLRILHGGLRYLQSADLRRFRRSVRARRWFFRTFPELVRPLPCIMPLYGGGLRRPPVLRAALALNDLLSARRNVGVHPSRHLPGGSVLGPRQTVERCSVIPEEGLLGGALWFDGLMVEPQRILVECLRWACREGATALNYSEVVGLEAARGSGVRRVVVRHPLDGTERVVSARRVVFCVGPDARALEAALGASPLPLPPGGLAFNVLLEHPLPTRGAVAVESPSGDAVLFALPIGSLTLAGTIHLPATTDVPPETPPPAIVERFIQDLGGALPDWGVMPQHVVRIMSGVLPGHQVGRAELSRRPTVIPLDHEGGPRGAWVVVAIKYTMAPLLATEVLDRIGLEGVAVESAKSRRPPVRDLPSAGSFLDLAADDSSTARKLVQDLAAEESVTSAQDLVLRRTDWGLHPSKGKDVLDTVTRYLGDSGSSDPF